LHSAQIINNLSELQTCSFADLQFVLLEYFELYVFGVIGKARYIRTTRQYKKLKKKSRPFYLIKRMETPDTKDDVSNTVFVLSTTNWHPKELAIQIK